MIRAEPYLEPLAVWALERLVKMGDSSTISTSPNSQSSNSVSSARQSGKSTRPLTRSRIDSQQLLTGLKTPRCLPMALESYAVPTEGSRIPDAFSKVLSRYLIPFGTLPNGDA